MRNASSGNSFGEALSDRGSSLISIVNDHFAKCILFVHAVNLAERPFKKAPLVQPLPHLSEESL
jgi:hypothetical protein